MLLQYHRDYASEALREIKMPKKIREEILTGVSANDLCEFTNEGQAVISGKDRITNLFGFRKKILGHSAIWQSHFGNLASMHAMSKTPGESAASTMAELRSWFDFLNGLALGRIDVNPNANIGSDNTPIDGMFKNHEIDYEQLFDTDEMAEIQYRSVGMMLHLIQDSFTLSHCERNENMEIVAFYCYEHCFVNRSLINMPYPWFRPVGSGLS